jgi:anti-anti-sigma regulatory factor
MATELQKAEAHTILPVDRLGDTLLVVPHGDLGSYSPQAFQVEFQRVQELLADPSLKNLIVDLGNSRYFGSEMIGALVALRERVKDRGRAVLVEMSADTRIGLETIKADQLFEIRDSRTEVLRTIPRLTFRERLRRYRRPLVLGGTLLLVVALAYGLFVSKVGYQVFGSRTARTYMTLANQWKRYESAESQWTQEEGRVYRAELLDRLESLEETLSHPPMIAFPEDPWLTKANSQFMAVVRGQNERREQFFRCMRWSRVFIRRRTALPLPIVGPLDWDSEFGETAARRKSLESDAPPAAATGSAAEAEREVPAEPVDPDSVDPDPVDSDQVE